MKQKEIELMNSRIENYITIAQNVKSKKIAKYFKESFRTINNRSRYKYFWQMDTKTHEALLAFYVYLSYLLKDIDTDGDESLIYYILVTTGLKTQTKAIQNNALTTIYLALKLYKENSRYMDRDLGLNRISLHSLLSMIDGECEFVFTKDLKGNEPKINVDGNRNNETLDNNKDEALRVFDEYKKKGHTHKRKKKSMKDHLQVDDDIDITPFLFTKF